MSSVIVGQPLLPVQYGAPAPSVLYTQGPCPVQTVVTVQPPVAVQPVVTVQPAVTMTLTQWANPEPDYLCYSIFTMLCCVCPLGLAALVYSIKTQNANTRGHQPIARRNSRMARILNHVNVAVGVLIWLIIVIFVIITVVAVTSTVVSTVIN